MRRRKDARKDDVERVTQRLCSERPEVGQLELDRIKTKAMSRAQAAGWRTGTRRRFVVASATVGLMAAGTGSVIAGGVTRHSAGNAATAEYGHSGIAPQSARNGVKGYRDIRIHIHVRRKGKLKKVTVRVNGKIVSVLKGKSASVNVNLVGLPCSERATKVVVIAVMDNGKIIKQSRQYRC